MFYGALVTRTFCLGLGLPLVTSDQHASVGRIINISLGSPSFSALPVTGVCIDLVGGRISPGS